MALLFAILSSTLFVILLLFCTIFCLLFLFAILFAQLFAIPFAIKFSKTIRLLFLNIGPAMIQTDPNRSRTALFFDPLLHPIAIAMKSSKTRKKDSYALGVVKHLSLSVRTSFSILGRALSTSFIEDCSEHAHTTTKIPQTLLIQLPHQKNEDVHAHKS